MENFYFSVNLDNNSRLFLAPITDRTVELSGQEIEDQSGYFLFERRCMDGEEEIDVIAQVLSEEAAFRLKEIFNMS